MRDVFGKKGKIDKKEKRRCWPFRMRDNWVALLPPWISFPSLYNFCIFSFVTQSWKRSGFLKRFQKPAHPLHAGPNWSPCWQIWWWRSINIFLSDLKDSLVDIRKRCRPSCICFRGEVCSPEVNHVLLPDKGIEQLDDLCIDYWLFVLIISLSILSTERQGTAMYYLPDEGIEQLQRCCKSISSKL